MKKILITILVSLILIPMTVFATSGKITVSSTNTVVVGNSVTVTVTLSGSDIGSWEMTLNYDKNYLQLTNSEAEAGGTVMAGSVSSAISSKKYKFKFKTLKKGSTTISVKGYEAYAFSDMKEISLTSSGKTIKIITQEELEASYSKDNNLKSLAVEGYELDKAFDKNETSYVVNVPEGTTSVNINAEASDNKASVSGDGSISVSEGINNIEIIVRAENGSEKKYLLTINVIDQNPINVTINNNNYTVIKLRDNYECPSTFTTDELVINDIQIPACYNENLDYHLVGLKLSDGTIESFIYNDGVYTKYNEATGTSLKIVILDYNNDLEGMKKYDEVIDGVSYHVYKNNPNAKFYIVYGVNVSTGEKNFYRYDTINKTFSLYDNTELNEILKLNKIYLYIIIAFGCSLGLAIICLVSLLSKNKKIRKNNLKEEKNSKKEEETKHETNEKKEEKKIKEEDTIIDEKNKKKGRKKKEKKTN